MTDTSALWLLAGLLLGIGVTLLAGYVGCRLAWRLQGNEGRLLRNEPVVEVPLQAGTGADTFNDEG